MRARFVSFAFLAATASVVACGADHGSTPGAGESVKASTAKIIHGTASTEDQNFAVLIYQADTSAGGFECTGSLITPNLVLTARHCVAEVTSEGIGCNADGTSNAGYKAPVDPTLLAFFKGTQRPNDVGTPDAKGTKVYVDSGNSVCNDDVALVLLDTPIYFGATIAPVRLDGDPHVGDLVTAIGWGVSDQANQLTGYLPNIRLQRTDIPILAVGPSTSPIIAKNMFELGESICQGDSGGPEIDQKTGAIIAVTSIGGNGNQDPAAFGTPQECDDEPTNKLKAFNYPTRIQPFKDMILQAAKDSGFDLWIEGQPDPRLKKFGEACKADVDCQTKLCVANAGVGADAGPFADAGAPLVCTQSCDATNVCPTGFDCTASDSGTSVCTAHTDAVVTPPASGGGGKSGCATTGTPPSAGWGSLVAAAGLALAFTRRRAKKNA